MLPGFVILTATTNIACSVRRGRAKPEEVPGKTAAS